MKYPLRFKPSEQFILNLKQGDLILSLDGYLRRVRKIVLRNERTIGFNDSKHQFVQYHTNQLYRTDRLIGAYDNHELIEIERNRKPDDHLPLGLNNDYEDLFENYRGLVNPDLTTKERETEYASK